jgi:hypothetical protein
MDQSESDSLDKKESKQSNDHTDSKSDPNVNKLVNHQQRNNDDASVRSTDVQNEESDEDDNDNDDENEEDEEME